MNPHGDRGSASMEFVILAPALMLLLGLVAVCSRIGHGAGVVSDTAEDSARIASISRSAPAAEANALAAAHSDLAGSNLHCATLRVSVDTSEFSTPVGTPASVTVSVYCVLDFSDLLIPGLPGSHVEQATFTEVVDRYREH